MSFDHWLSDGRMVSSSYVLSKNVPETWETSCNFFCHIAHCSYFYLKNLFRNLCTCFHFLPVLSWTPLGTQRNTWFLLHFLGVRPKGISTMSVIFCLVGLCHKVFTEAFDLWALTIGIVPSHGTQFDSWTMCLTMPSLLIIVVISSNMIQNCFIWFHNYKDDSLIHLRIAISTPNPTNFGLALMTFCDLVNMLFYFQRFTQVKLKSVCISLGLFIYRFLYKMSNSRMH